MGQVSAPATVAKPRILLFGAIGPFTGALSRVLGDFAELPACVVHVDQARWLRSIHVREVTGIAAPVWEVTDLQSARLYKRLRRLQADLVVVAGFAKLLPAPEVNACARFGAVNLHPALLPNDRGTSPLFWVLRRGDSQTGVTVHELTERFDEGPIVATARWPMPFGLSGREWFHDAGRRAGELLRERLASWLVAPRPSQPQGESQTPWARRPKHADFQIEASEWSAGRLFHFVRGARFFGSPWARLADDHYYFEDALDWVEGGKLPGEFMVLGNELTLQVRDGYVRFRLSAT